MTLAVVALNKTQPEKSAQAMSSHLFRAMDKKKSGKGCNGEEELTSLRQCFRVVAGWENGHRHMKLGQRALVVFVDATNVQYEMHVISKPSSSSSSSSSYEQATDIAFAFKAKEERKKAPRTCIRSKGGICEIFDHVVILVAYDTLQGLSDRLKGSLDGSYIELIAFVPGVNPDRRRHHRWGQLPENTVVDWAYTLEKESDFATVQQRVAATGFTYEDAVPGGRTLSDGTEIKWAVSMPRVEPGQLPFWCLDRTPRGLRVPFERKPDFAQHPSGARGVSRLLVSVRSDHAPALTRAYDALHGAQMEDGGWRFDVFVGKTGGVGCFDRACAGPASLRRALMPLPRLRTKLGGRTRCRRWINKIAVTGPTALDFSFLCRPQASTNRSPQSRREAPSGEAG
ncbi:hypothetical protein XA68_16629 [Ophiocordyceps unilateralis]|uniref:Glyoxalase-like domain-containing protein n=1 Tax=Ophiocordyceps unilateralis TaxID=268505 RepID=A0A2A9PSI5_OPHUN|nr:hypothetical protein XA68_16629 [Ophiocordyceps unilateralis]